MMKTVKLYTKLDCPPCDEAYKMLLAITLELPLEIDVVDITHQHNNLETRYGQRIPVIALPGAAAELDWPFSADELRAYLRQTA